MIAKVYAYLTRSSPIHRLSHQPAPWRSGIERNMQGVVYCQVKEDDNFREIVLIKSFLSLFKTVCSGIVVRTRG